MEPITIITVIISILAVVAIFCLIPYLTKLSKDNNFNTQQVLKSTEDVLVLVNTLIKSLNVQPQSQDIVEQISKYSLMAVRYAEQLYSSGQLPKEERKNEAIKFVEQALKDNGVEVNEDRKKLIAAVVESAVFLLPKTEQEVVKSSKKK